MAFHVACPITCRRICFCPLGFPRGTNPGAFLDDVKRIEELLRDPEAVRAPKGNTVQVLVPKVAVPPPPPTPITIHLAAAPPPVANSQRQVVVVADEDGEQADEASAQTKRVALQRKADAAKVAAEDYARKFEAGDVMVATKDDTADEQGVSNTNVFCRMCFLGEKEGNERARRMLSCKVCSKKYHRSCLKSWAQNRDLFHWSSWTCPSCRTCEICRKVGDPSKFMFCRRCDGAYHCYCQHPPHKNVSSGPYLCPKHTRCHSCGSNVPGNGLSVRWFLGYTCCDACGRLFVKGNYCPVCLKVYRDSESTPMVCCDTCQRWVHCHCDNISDQKYLQFQVDGNLQYKCATCRGECYQVKDLEDAVQELWRRRDEADQGLIASLRAAAGLPTQEEIFLISPFSDDEDSGPGTLKKEVGSSLKLSLKGLGESPKKSKDSGKKTGKKKNAKKKKAFMSGDKADPKHHETEYDGRSFGDSKDNIIQSHNKGGVSFISSNVVGPVNLDEGVGSMSQPAVPKHKLVDEVMASDGERTSRIVKIKSKRPHDLNSGDDTEQNSQSKMVKAKKLVINLGPRKINVSNSPRSDTSSGQREQDLTTSNGSGDAGNRLMVNADDGNAKNNDGDADKSSNKIIAKYARREGSLIKFGRTKSESSKLNPKTVGGSSSEGFESIAPDSKAAPFVKRSMDSSRSTIGSLSDVPFSGSSKVPLGKQSEGKHDTSAERNDSAGETPVLQSSAKDSKFSIKLKIKKPNLENQNNQGLLVEEEKSAIRGQRSKRKRPSSFMDKSVFKDDSGMPSHHDSEMMEASWILKKLGKDAIGKRVEVYQPSDVSWHKGVVSEFTEGTSVLSVTLDDGKVKSLELGKQPIRFVPQKQKRSGL